MSKLQIEPGRTYAVPFPFVLEDVEIPPDDPEATALVKVKSWRPGIEWDTDNYGNSEACADALGEMLLTVVDIHKPGRFPSRVFYTRQWKDPKGRVFGKGGLRITTLEAFRRRATGYRHEVYIDGFRWPSEQPESKHDR